MTCPPLDQVVRVVLAAIRCCAVFFSLSPLLLQRQQSLLCVFPQTAR